MTSSSIYQLKKEGYLIHAEVKTKSGFHVFWDPFIRIAVDDANDNVLANAIKTSLQYEHKDLVPDPTNWKEFEETFLRKAGLPSNRSLQKAGTKLVGASKKDKVITLQSTKRVENANFIPIGNDIQVSESASTEELMKALALAFDQCES